MTQKKDDGKGTPERGPEQAGQKRPFATIDLRATEVKAEATATAGATKSAGAKPDAKSDPKADLKASVLKEAGVTAATANAAASNAATTRSGPGFGRLAAYAGAALIGGLAALFGAEHVGPVLGLNGAKSPSADPKVVDAMTQRLAKLERTATERPATEAAQVNRLMQQLNEAASRIERLEGQNRQLATLADTGQKLAALEQKLARPAESEIELKQRLMRLEDSLKGLAAIASTPQGQQVPEIARLTAKLNEVDAALVSVRKAVAPEVMAQVNAQMTAAVDARLTEARKSEARTTETLDQLRTANGRLGSELEAIKTEGAKLTQLIETIRAETAKLDQSLVRARGDTGSLKADIDAMRSELSAQLKNYTRSVEMKSAFEPIERRFTDLDTRLNGVLKAEGERQSSAQRILVALELGNLKRALDAGRGYGAELAQVERVSGGKLNLAPLKPYVDKGVPTLAALQGRFGDVVTQVLEAEQSSKQGSVVDSLLASAKSVVQIRRVGADVKGDSAEAVLARTESHLKSGNLEPALKEVQALKPELKEATKGWIGQLEARLAVDRALKVIEDGLKTSLTGGSGE